VYAVNNSLKCMHERKKPELPII